MRSYDSGALIIAVRATLDISKLKVFEETYHIVADLPQKCWAQLPGSCRHLTAPVKE